MKLRMRLRGERVKLRMRPCVSSGPRRRAIEAAVCRSREKIWGTYERCGLELYNKYMQEGTG